MTGDEQAAEGRKSRCALRKSRKFRMEHGMMSAEQSWRRRGGGGGVGHVSTSDWDIRKRNESRLGDLELECLAGI